MARETKDSSEGDDRRMSKASIDAAVQAAFELCATCSHDRGGHEEDQACGHVREERNKKGVVVREIACRCKEYWPMRDEREDGERVVEYAIGFGGGMTLVLNRRVTTELWESLQADRAIEFRLRARVTGKGFRPKREEGVTIGLVATRKLTVETLQLVDRDGEVFDA